MRSVAVYNKKSIKAVLQYCGIKDDILVAEAMS